MMVDAVPLSAKEAVYRQVWLKRPPRLAVEVLIVWGWGGPGWGELSGQGECLNWSDFDKQKLSFYQNGLAG